MEKKQSQEIQLDRNFDHCWPAEQSGRQFQSFNEQSVQVPSIQTMYIW